MTDPGPRTGTPRDVPPPRPVSASDGLPEEEGGLGRAARAVADAVAGLLGSSGSAPRARSAAAGMLRDVVGAVASAAARRGPQDPADPPSQAAGSPDPDGGRNRGPTALLGELLTAASPRLPIRDARRLREAYPELSREEIADLLVARAVRATSAIGAATGGLSAAQWFATPSLLALPLQLGADAVLSAAVEIVLVGELHELYDRPAPGDATARAAAYLASWSNRRADDGSAAGLTGVLTVAGARALRRRAGRSLGRTLPAAAPFLLGAVLASRGNRKATETLAQRVRTDLRGRLGGGPYR